MAEEQAYHVRQGLECLKAIRDNPPCIEEIQAVASIRDSSIHSDGSSSITASDSPARNHDITELLQAADGSNEGSSLLSAVSGVGATAGEKNGPLAPEQGSWNPDSRVQRYHVFSHGGQAVEGVEDVDSLLVPASVGDDVELEEGDEGSDGSYDDSHEFNSSRTSGDDRGSAPSSGKIRSTDVSTINEEEITALLGGTPNPPASKKGIRGLNFPSKPDLTQDDPTPESIKKGTEERSTSSGMETGSLSTGGATPLARVSPKNPSGQGAPAGNVPQSAASAKTTPKCATASGTPVHPLTEPYPEDDDGDDDELFNEIYEIKTAIAKINEDNQLILGKLDAVLQLKGEVDSIKKQLNKQNIALSTIEGHISSILIAIPGFGKGGQERTSDVDINPDLKPILSRDSGRALAEVLKASTEPRTSTPGPSNVPESRRKLLREMRIKPIDKNTSSAIGFKPKDDLPSKAVITSIIKSSNLSESHKSHMIALLQPVKGDKDIQEFYKVVTSIVENQKR